MTTATFRRAATALAVAAAFSSGAAFAQSPGQQKQELRYAAGVVLVSPKAGLSEKELDKVLQGHGGKRKQHWRELNVHIVEVPANANALQVAEALARNPHIKFAQVDVKRKVDMVPNDPQYGSAWHLPLMGAPLAWDRSQGTGVTVAVCDSGVDATHPDLVRVPGYNMFDGNTNSADVYGHGTMVAGAVAMAGANGVGGAGVAFRTRIMPIRVTDTNGWGYDSAIANCITYAADMGARGANVSFGGVCGSPIIQSAAKYMRDRGGVVTASAGNTGAQELTADTDLLTCVAATNSADARTSWSTFGPFVDVAAPGENIFTTSRGGGYGGASGTSFAAPVTLGVYALMMAANPNLSPATLDNILFTTAKDLGTAGRDAYHGWGRIDAAAAVAKAASMVAADTTAPAVSIKGPLAGAKVSGIATVDVAATDAGGVASVELIVNGKSYATDLVGPFSFAWDTSTLADGPATLVAKAVDASGNASTTQISVTVANDKTPPVAQILSPGAGAAVTGTVNVSASATDNNKVAKLTLSIDGREVAVTYGPSLSYAWSTGGTTTRKGGGRKSQTTTTVGTSTITVVAEDPAGNRGSASQTVTRQ